MCHALSPDAIAYLYVKLVAGPLQPGAQHSICLIEFSYDPRMSLTEPVSGRARDFRRMRLAATLLLLAMTRPSWSLPKRRRSRKDQG